MDKVNLDTWFSQVELSARGLIEPSAYLGPYDVRNVYRDEDPDVLDFARRHACAELTDCGPQILQRDLKNVFLSDAGSFLGASVQWGRDVLFFSDIGKSVLSTEPAPISKSSLEIREIDHAVSLFIADPMSVSNLITEVLPRVWMAETYGNAEPTYVLAGSAPPFVRKFLGDLGIKQDRVIDADLNSERVFAHKISYFSPLKMDQMIHPSFSLMADWVRTQLGVKTRDNEDGRQPLYLLPQVDRHGEPITLCANEEEVRSILVDHYDFKTVDFANKSVAQQISLIANADMIWGELAPRMQLSLFMRKNGRVAVSRNRLEKSLFQSGLCRARGQTLINAFGDIVDQPPFNPRSKFSIPAPVVHRAAKAMIDGTEE